MIGRTLESVDEANAALAAEGADVEVRPEAIPYDALHTKLATAIPRGHGPDLFVAAHDRVGDWARQGLVLAISADAVTERAVERDSAPAPADA